MAETAAEKKQDEGVTGRVTKAVAHHSKKLAESAEQLKDSTIRIEDSADRTTRLAADRTVLAAERTYAAWMRTALVAGASGVGAKALLAGLIPSWMILANATVLVVFSIFCLVAAVWRQFYSYRPPPVPDTQTIPPWILISISTFLAIVALLALLGIWMVPVWGI